VTPTVGCRVVTIEIGSSRRRSRASRKRGGAFHRQLGKGKWKPSTGGQRQFLVDGLKPVPGLKRDYGKRESWASARRAQEQIQSGGGLVSFSSGNCKERGYFKRRTQGGGRPTKFNHKILPIKINNSKTVEVLRGERTAEKEAWGRAVVIRRQPMPGDRHSTHTEDRHWYE